MATSLHVIDRTSKQKVSEGIENLKNIIILPDLIDFYRSYTYKVDSIHPF
jgi:hypothetical protein